MVSGVMVVVLLFTNGMIKETDPIQVVPIGRRDGVAVLNTILMHPLVAVDGMFLMMMASHCFSLSVTCWLS